MATESLRPRPAPVRARAAGGRLSHDATRQFAGLNPVILPPPDAEGSWRTENLDDRALDRTPPARLLELLIDLVPDVSRAHWDFLRLLNPGIETWAAYRPGTEEVEGRAQAALDAIRARLDLLYGTADVPVNRLFTAALLRGAVLGEAVLDEAGRAFVDLATPDPASVRFRRAEDPARGQIWEAGQYQGGGFVPFDRETIRYIPIDPLPGNPYGRSPFAAALFGALFLIGVLHDLRRVVAQQGYHRLDITLDLEKIKASLDETIIGDQGRVVDWDEYRAVVDGIREQVEGVYSRLQPDQAFVHTDEVALNDPVGTITAGNLQGIDTLITVLRQLLTAGLKTMPLLLGITDGVSEANANRQWEILAAGVKSLQHPVEGLLEYLCGRALQAQGFVATVRIRFAELRAAEMLRDEQTRQLRITNATRAYAAGWYSQDEASRYAVDKAPDVQEPRAATTGDGAPDAATVQPEPGGERAGEAAGRCAVLASPEGAGVGDAQERTP